MEILEIIVTTSFFYLFSVLFATITLTIIFYKENGIGYSKEAINEIKNEKKFGKLKKIIIEILLECILFPLIIFFTGFSLIFYDNLKLIPLAFLISTLLVLV